MNSKRCGTSASRSFGPMSGSSSIISKTWSMTVRNSFSDVNSAPMASGGRAAGRAAERCRRRSAASACRRTSGSCAACGRRRAWRGSCRRAWRGASTWRGRRLGAGGAGRLGARRAGGPVPVAREDAARLVRARDAVLLAAGLAAPSRFSSAAMRRPSASMSLRRPLTSSRTRSSSIVARMRAAAWVTSSTSWRERFWVPAAPSEVAWKVRSIAARRASIASDAVAVGLVLLVLLLGHGATLISLRVTHLRPHADVAERVLLPGDPGRALRLAQQLVDAPKMLNHNRGLWGYTGVAPRRRAADDPEHGPRRPEHGDRGPRADRARRAAAGPDRHRSRAPRRTSSSARS